MLSTFRRAPSASRNPVLHALGGALLLGTLLAAGNALADEAPPPNEPSEEGGCGCETTGYPSTYGALSLAFMGVGLVLFRRSLKKHAPSKDQRHDD